MDIDSEISRLVGAPSKVTYVTFDPVKVATGLVAIAALTGKINPTPRVAIALVLASQCSLELKWTR